LEDDISRKAGPGPAATSLSHNVLRQDEVEPLLEKLVQARELIRKVDAPGHGAFVGTSTTPTATHATSTAS